MIDKFQIFYGDDNAPASIVTFNGEESSTTTYKNKSEALNEVKKMHKENSRGGFSTHAGPVLFSIEVIFNPATQLSPRSPIFTHPSHNVCPKCNIAISKGGGCINHKDCPMKPIQ
jgi:hypothetical protein